METNLIAIIISSNIRSRTDLKMFISFEEKVKENDPKY